MDSTILLAKLLHFDFSALDFLKAETTRRIDHSDVAWQFLINAGKDGRHVPGGFCETTAEHVLANWGNEEFEKKVRNEWKSWPESTRQNFSYDLMGKEYMISNSTATELFYDDTTTNLERIVLLSSLVNLRKARRLPINVLEKMVHKLETSATITPKQRSTIRDLREEFCKDIDS